MADTWIRVPNPALGQWSSRPRPIGTPADGIYGRSRAHPWFRDAPAARGSRPYRVLSGAELAAAAEVLSSFLASLVLSIPDSEVLGPLEIAVSVIRAMLAGKLVAVSDLREAAFSDAMNERNALLAALRVILDSVDYTTSACRMNEMIGAVLPIEVIRQARAAIAKTEGRKP